MSPTISRERCHELLKTKIISLVFVLCDQNMPAYQEAARGEMSYRMEPLRAPAGTYQDPSMEQNAQENTAASIQNMMGAGITSLSTIHFQSH